MKLSTLTQALFGPKASRIRLKRRSLTDDEMTLITGGADVAADVTPSPNKLPEGAAYDPVDLEELTRLDDDTYGYTFSYDATDEWGNIDVNIKSSNDYGDLFLSISPDVLSRFLVSQAIIPTEEGGFTFCNIGDNGDAHYDGLIQVALDSDNAQLSGIAQVLTHAPDIAQSFTNGDAVIDSQAGDIILHQGDPTFAPIGAIQLETPNYGEDYFSVDRVNLVILADGIYNTHQQTTADGEDYLSLEGDKMVIIPDGIYPADLQIQSFDLASNKLSITHPYDPTFTSTTDNLDSSTFEQIYEALNAEGSITELTFTNDSSITVNTLSQTCMINYDGNNYTYPLSSIDLRSLNSGVVTLTITGLFISTPGGNYITDTNSEGMLFDY